MRIVICSNLTNGIGLQKDYELLRSCLEDWGHRVEGQQFNEPKTVTSADLCIWLEVINEHLIDLAPRHWYFANPEWLKPEHVRPIQRYVEIVFAKTCEAERALKERFQRVEYVGFLAEDRRDLTIPREPRFLHLGGNSGFRNTNAVIAAWREYRWWAGVNAPNADLTVVSSSVTTTMSQEETVPGLRLIKRASDEEIIHLQNSCLFHLWPSAYEGFGQGLHESQSVGAIILSTEAPPMNEFGSPRHVPSIKQKRNNFGVLHEVSPADIRDSVPWMLGLPNYEIARMQVEARARFEKGNREFRERFKPFIECPVATIQAFSSPSESSKAVQSPKKAKLAILGNFDAPFSTENDLLWTLRDMGHQTIPFQENRATTEEILEGCADVSLLIYVHTHGWTTPGKMSVDELIVRLRARGIKTVSFHLDRYWGLNKLDQREARIGAHPFWHTDHVFTADGGNQENFRERLGDDRHHWLPPGVVKRDCYLGEPQKDLMIDVGFVGAESYHPEYPFRAELIQFLRSVYGDQFKVFTGFRGNRLNDLYASIRVVVGDSCFGGIRRYWSDRVPETLGRGGMLIHPATEGLTIPGLVTFTPGDLYELQDKIDYYLDRSEERQFLGDAAHAWVKNNETYHNRMQTVLRTCGIS